MPEAKKKRTSVIKQYFSPDTKASEFVQEIKQLTEDEKNELAAGAAKNLGLTQEQCDFPIE